MAVNLLIFADDWGRFPSTMQHIAKHLGKQHTIIWVNSLGMRRPRFVFYDLKRLLSKFLNLIFAREKNYNSNDMFAPSYIVNPIAIPCPGSPWVQWLNGIMLSWQIKIKLKKCNITRPTILTTMPTSVNAIKRIESQRCIYYCCDDFSNLGGVDNEAIAKLESELARCVDHIIVVSESLRKKFAIFEPTVVPQGVDYSLFVMPQLKPNDLPNDKPLIGFCGGIESWVDLELIEKMAIQLNHCLILMLGPVRTNVSKLSKYPNIIFLGTRPYSEVAAYMQHWQVSILPFREELSAVFCCDPLKLREYLAAGKPVVVNNLPAAHHYATVISIGNSHQEFINHVRNYCDGTDDIGQDQRRLSVKDDDWINRAQQVQKLLAE